MALEAKFREYMKSMYHILKKSILARPLYYINDLYYVMWFLLSGKPELSVTDIDNVENNVTFIYKSFQRQKQAKRLYFCIKKYYPNVRVVIADDSQKAFDLCTTDSRTEVIHLPFNSGLSKGLNEALNLVETPFVMRMDDDELLMPKTNIHEQLSFLQQHPEVDLVGFQANYKHPEKMAQEYRRIRMPKQLLIPYGTIIEGKEVVYKSPNVFLARTDKLRQVGYDPNIRILDHQEFFFRAAGSIVSVQDPHSAVLHCHNRFEGEYDRYRSDVRGDIEYIRKKYWRK